MENHVLGITKQIIVMAIVISLILLFLGIAVLVLIHICIVGRTIRRGLTQGHVNMVERGSIGSTSMSQDDIEKLPCFNFKAKEKGSSPPGDCAVCLENFRAGERCRLLPFCNHSFHAECVDLWLLRNSICPICRADAGSICGEESSRFSEIGVEYRDGETGEAEEIERAETNGGNHSEVQIAGMQETLSSSERVIEVRETAEAGEIAETSGGNQSEIQIAGLQEGESGNSNSNTGDELGLNQRVEVLESPRTSSPKGQTTETLNSSERVIEVRESQEN